jgi:hypothetical protein
VLLDPRSTSQKQKRVWIPIGVLPLLKVGEIWRDRQLEFSPDYELETFRDVLIDQSTTTLVKAGLNLDNEGFLIPSAEHPWHMGCTHSYCQMVELPDGRRLIIPCMELLRFYFGSSSSLVTRILQPGLTRADLYSAEATSFDAKSGRLALTLAERISGASAADIGRLHLDRYAWWAALQVGTSVLSATTKGTAIHPKAFFPFLGKSDLAVSGKWLSFAGRMQS